MNLGSKILDVEKPGRYEGIEAGVTPKPWEGASLRVALAFPDTYEIGTSHLGIKILHELFNAVPGVLAERAFAVWPDMEALLRREGAPLGTRESGRALKDFDLVGFTLQYELSATNVLQMLELGQIPLLRFDRGEGDPIVIGGGPVAANPEPLSDFFDAFFIGEAEEAVAEIAMALLDAKGLTRDQRLDALGKVPGVYLPKNVAPIFEEGRFAGFSAGSKVRRRVVADLANAKVPKPISTFGETVHERLAIEIARGCTRGCRFCQAGYLYRPVREREPGAIIEAVRSGLSASGMDEIGLLSLSTGDYSCIGELLLNLMDEYEEKKISVSLPSLRTESLSDRIMEEVKRVRKSGLTLAPEAGSDRLRTAINKDFTDQQIIDSIARVFEAGWSGVKLYFMIGLPTETPEDHQALINLSRKIVGLTYKNRARITVSVSNFVPKAHTPFQWERQIGIEEIFGVQRIFSKEIPGKRADLKTHDAYASVVEGTIARGDRRLGAVIMKAYQNGARMDGWTSEFKYSNWDKAFADSGLTVAEFLRERELCEPLPWDLVDAGIKRMYLVDERQKARTGTPTGDCRTGACTGCGFCDFDQVKPRKAQHKIDFPQSGKVVEPEPEDAPKYRLVFKKLGPARLLSHLETNDALIRAFRGAGIKFLHSKGFNPRPKITLGPALQLGVESECEYCEFKAIALPPLAKAVEEVNKRLPQGLIVDSLWNLGDTVKGLTGGNTVEEYRLTLTQKASDCATLAGGLDAVVKTFADSAEFSIVKRRQGKPDKATDAKKFVRNLWREGGDLRIITVRDQDGRTVSPEVLLHTLLGMDEGQRALERVLKLTMNFI